MKKTVMTTVIIALLVSALRAGVGTTSIDILKVPVGIKAQSMGGAYVAICDDNEAMDINPGGLGKSDKLSIMFVHDLYLQEIFFDSLYFATPVGAGTLGVSVKYMNTGTITQTLEDTQGNYAGEGDEISGMNFLGGVGFGLNMGKIAYNEFSKNLNIGGSINVTGEMLGDDYSNIAVSADIGGMYTIVIEEADFMSNRGQSLWNEVGIGIVFRNLGTSFGQNITPISIALGGYTQFINMGVTGNRIRVSADTDYNFNNGINLRAGLEYMQLVGNYHFAVRAGTNFNPEERQFGGFTAGCSLGINMNGKVYQVDYVFVPYGDLGISQKIGLSLKF